MRILRGQDQSVKVSSSSLSSKSFSMYPCLRKGRDEGVGAVNPSVTQDRHTFSKVVSRGQYEVERT